MTFHFPNSELIEFLSHGIKNKIFLTYIQCLHHNVLDSFNLENIRNASPESNNQKIQFNTIQISLAFMVKGKVVGVTVRVHFDHLLIYKDSSNQMFGMIIDSTINCICVFMYL